MRVLVCVPMKFTEEDAEFCTVRVTRHCETPNIDVRSQSLVLEMSREHSRCGIISIPNTWYIT